MRIAPLIAALILTTAAPALAATQCSGGHHVADAQIVPQRNVGEVLRATQFAFDGDRRITHVCNLTNGGGRDFTSVWNLYSGEVDADFGGICVQLTNTAGVDFYSCATAEAVQRAFAAPLGSHASRLHFDDWQRGIHVSIRH